jgi:hypothetical protein
MLPPPGAIAAGGLYTATEFDVTGLDSLRPSLVEMGRAVVRDDHRNGGVVLLMWAGILAYLDRCGYDYVCGCVSVPVDDPAGPPGSQIRGVRDFVMRRHAAPAEYTVYPYRPVMIDGRGLDDIDPPARVSVPALMRGYLRLGAQVCGEPAHDPGFGVGDFPTLLDKRQADYRYLKRLRSVAAASEMADGIACVSTDANSPGCLGRRATPLRSRGAAPVVGQSSSRMRVACVPLRGDAAVGGSAAGDTRCPAVAHPAGLLQADAARAWGANHGVRRPDSQLAGRLVVSGHVSWVDIFAIGAVMPGSFVAKAEMISWPGSA